MTKYNYDGYTFQVIHDPIKQVYFCGIPGKEMPTIYVGHSESEVKDAVEALLDKPRDVWGSDEFCDEMEISYDAQEAYCSGWVIREYGAIVKEEELQKKRYDDNNKIRAILSRIEKNEENAKEIENLFQEMNDLEERQADIEEERQHTRRKLIRLAEESGHPLCRADNVHIMKIIRLGIQKSA